MTGGHPPTWVGAEGPRVAEGPRARLGERLPRQLPGQLQRPGAAATAGLGSLLPFPALAVTRGHCVGFPAATQSRNVPAVYGPASLTRSGTAVCTPTRMAVGGGQGPPSPASGCRWPGRPQGFSASAPAIGRDWAFQETLLLCGSPGRGSGGQATTTIALQALHLRSRVCTHRTCKPQGSPKPSPKSHLRSPALLRAQATPAKRPQSGDRD